MGPPGGGPEDKEPPRILQVSPPPGTTGVDPKSTIEFTFSEPVDRESVIEALFITPPQEKKPRVKVKGGTVRVILREPIPDDRTLVVSLGTTVQDLRRNKLEESFAVALTAGDKIDMGRIIGMIFAPKDLQGMLVGAWLTDDSLVIDPVESPPEFLTQTGVNGGFSMDFMSAGKYRIACWDDRDRDRLYDPGTDRLGLPWRDVTLEEDAEAWIELYPTRHDTSVTRLFMVSASDRNHLTLRYNKRLDRDPGEIMLGLSIFDSTGALGLRSFWLDAADSSKLVLYTEEQRAEGEYKVVLSDDTTFYTFTGSSIPDTMGPRVVGSYPAGNERSVNEALAGWIGFDDVLTETDFDTLLTLTVSDTGDTARYPVRCRLEEANLLRWEADDTLPFGMECTLRVDMTSIRDGLGNPSPDTSWSITFHIVDPTETGAVSGVVVKGHPGYEVIVARSVEGRSRSETSVRAGTGGTFKIERLVAGAYMIWAFNDEDEDGVYDFGTLDPFSFAESFTVRPDTVRIRKRWETEDVTVEFRLKDQHEK